MNANEVAKISTYAKFMVCPEVLHASNSKIDLPALGASSFESYKYRHLSDNYTGESIADIDVLLTMLANEMAQRLKGCDVVLLLSDGKDSLTLALALNKLGLRCKTLTLLRRNDIELRSYIQKVAIELGHEPYFVTVDEIIASFDYKTFAGTFSKAEHPVLDQGYLFFLGGLKIFFEQNSLDQYKSVVVDGLGNDEYLGYLPSKMQHRSFLVSQLNLWKIRPSQLPYVNWYVRSPSESHGMLSAISAFFPIPKSHDLNSFFSRIPKGRNREGYIDFRAFARGSHHDHFCMMAKTRLACAHLGVALYFPWLEEKISNYCFNLPIESKYDFKSNKNKIILRELLHKRLGWEQQKRGVDLYFDLPLDDFVAELRGFIPYRLLNRIIENKFVSNNVKKRAILELLNLFSFCEAKGMSVAEIELLLEG